MSVPKINQIGMLDIKGNEQIRRVYGINGISPTLNTMQEGNREPKILKIANETGNHYGGGVFNKEGISPTLVSSGAGEGTNNLPKIVIDDTQGFEKEARVYKDYSPSLRASRSGLKTIDNFRIRKLTPKECWRLQGFSDKQFKKAEKVNSNSQLYKQAGNSITVNVLVEILKQMKEYNYL